MSKNLKEMLLMQHPHKSPGRTPTTAYKLKTAELRKIYKIKLPDAIIAATALVYDLTLISRNFADFNRINGLKVKDPYKL